MIKFENHAYIRVFLVLVCIVYLLPPFWWVNFDVSVFQVPEV